MPQVSIIITTHNRVALLQKAIDSARHAGTDAEIIVVDDASTDDTQNYCTAQKDIIYVRLDINQKTAGARNAGFAASTAPYINWLDDDDWRLPDTLSQQINILEKDAACGMVYGQYINCNQQGEILDLPAEPQKCIEGDLLMTLLEKNFIPPATAVIRRECLAATGLFDTAKEMVGIEDWDLWIRIAELYPVRCIQMPVAVYRKPEQHSKQWSSNLIRQFSYAGKAYKEKWVHLPRIKKILNESKEPLLNNWLKAASDKILYDAANNSKGINGRLKNFYKVIQCYPGKWRELKFYKAFVKSFFA